MGWNLSLVHATGPAATVEAFAIANGYRPDPDGVLRSFEEAITDDHDGDWARPTLAIAELGAGLVIAGRLILNHDWAAGLSDRRGAATWAAWQSTSTTYGFAHYEDGALVRELQRSEHATLHEVGAPLPQERSLRWHDPQRVADDEADLFDLVGQVTGLPDAARWLASPARIHRPVPITALEPPDRKKRRLFGR
jgi:hypothetical protein